MEIKTAASSALLGIRSGLDGLDRNAAELASAKQARGEASPIGPLLDSRANQRQIEVNAKVLKSVDEMMGSLLDELA
jgi:hypothetical protein